LNVVIWLIATGFVAFTTPGVEAGRATNTFYCSLSHTTINKVQSYEIIILVGFMGITQIFILVTFFQRWEGIRSLLKGDDVDKGSSQDVRLLLHTTGLTWIMMIWLAFAAGVQHKTLIAATLLSTLPILTAFSLGARRDIWQIAYMSTFANQLVAGRHQTSQSLINPLILESQITGERRPSILPARRFNTHTKERPLPALPLDHGRAYTSTELRSTSGRYSSDGAPPRYSACEDMIVHTDVLRRST